jgi:chromate reductase
MTKKIGVLVGSIRKDSWHKKLAQNLIKLAPATLQLEVIEIADLPLYNEDYDTSGNPPAAYTTFRDSMRTLQGILFVTPEYNRSVPAPLKNAIDVGSRPWGKSIWGAKPCGVISGSMGPLGGFGANHHLRQSLVCLDVWCMQQPEAYIGSIHTLFEADGSLSKPETREFLQKFMDSFANWVNKF